MGLGSIVEFPCTSKTALIALEQLSEDAKITALSISHCEIVYQKKHQQL